MKIKMFGTRGSTPIARKNSTEMGGNTTCLRVHSLCTPQNTALVVDAGSGYVEASKEMLGEQLFNVTLLFTHWHHDHTQGLMLAPHTFIEKSQMRVYGPKEHGVGVTDVFGNLMRALYFPVEYAKIRHRVKANDLEHVGTQVLVIHPQGGFHLMPVYQFEKAENEKTQLSLGKARYHINECMVVWMRRTEHPEYTVSYRFEERPTGQVFVFLTDHENTVALPNDLRRHLQGANLIVQDCQYSDERYQTQTAGFGHGTPSYCAKIMVESVARYIGITHHDPGASDEDVKKRLAELHAQLDQLGYPQLIPRAFICADYSTIDLDELPE